MIKPSIERISQGLFWEKSLRLVQGCTKVSKGCDNCWAEKDYRRFSKNHQVEKYFPQGCDWKGNVTATVASLEIPLTTKKPTLYAVWTDLFHESILELTDFEWEMTLSGKHLISNGKKRTPFLFHVFHTFIRCPQHIFIVLTKRPDNMKTWMTEWFEEMVFEAPENVIFGVSVEDQESADKRIPLLLQTPASRRVVCFEPALSEIDIRKYLPTGAKIGEVGIRLDNTLDWVIAGGESGKNARPTHPQVFSSIQEQCSQAGTPFFFKGWGEYWMTDNEQFFKVGKKKSGRKLNGKTYSEFPD